MEALAGQGITDIALFSVSKMKRSRDDGGGYGGGGRGGFGGFNRGRGGMRGGRGGGNMKTAVIRISGGVDGKEDVVPVQNLYAEKKQRIADGVNPKQAQYQECWICGQTDHRRADCPKLQEQNNIQKKVVCLGCRRIGHKLADCPQKGKTYHTQQGEGATDGGGTCFNCGGTHRLRDCPEPRNGSHLPFAMCFVCNSKGHLAKDCPENKERGLYPRGGGCKACGSVYHFVKDCADDPRKGWASNTGGATSSSAAPAASSSASAQPAREHSARARDEDGVQTERAHQEGDGDDLGGNTEVPKDKSKGRDGEEGGANYSNRAKKGGSRDKKHHRRKEE